MDSGKLIWVAFGILVFVITIVAVIKISPALVNSRMDLPLAAVLYYGGNG